jgi:hypothetical protein
MRFSWRFLLFMALGFSPHQSFAQDAPCPSYPDVPIAISAHFDSPVYDHSQDIDHILSLANDARHSIHEGLTLGVTRYNPFIEFRIALEEVTRNDKFECAYVHHVDVDFGYKDVVVYIASEIPEDSCGFNEIMAHEQKHIDVNKAILDEYAPRIERELKDYLKMNGVFKQVKEDYARAVMHEKLQQLLNNIAEEMGSDNQRRQQAIDTRAEYERVSADCGGQLRGVAARFLQGR